MPTDNSPPVATHTMDADALQKLIYLLHATDDPLIQEQALITLSNSAAFSVNQVSIVLQKTTTFQYRSAWKMRGAVLLKREMELSLYSLCSKIHFMSMPQFLLAQIIEFTSFTEFI